MVDRFCISCFLPGSQFSTQSLVRSVHPLQVFAQCPMMTERVSNEKVLLVHTGTTVRVIPWETGHWLLAQKWRVAGSCGAWTFWGLKPISRYATEFLNGHTVKVTESAVRALGSSCSTEQHVSPHRTSTSSSHTLHLWITQVKHTAWAELRSGGST